MLLSVKVSFIAFVENNISVFLFFVKHFFEKIKFFFGRCIGSQDLVIQNLVIQRMAESSKNGLKLDIQRIGKVKNSSLLYTNQLFIEENARKKNS